MVEQTLHLSPIPATADVFHRRDECPRALSLGTSLLLSTTQEFARLFLEDL
jgi:hypothetical protein